MTVPACSAMRSIAGRAIVGGLIETELIDAFGGEDRFQLSAMLDVDRAADSLSTSEQFAGKLRSARGAVAPFERDDLAGEKKHHGDFRFAELGVGGAGGGRNPQASIMKPSQFAASCCR